ncbi:hypothetical protein RHSIM_Rhsim03G0188800 [Rhododendron simsii]|uniref:Hydroxyproline-rich glycoprotein family protein n=1 Tax=Rhododendron simsii TaxID=118357 RepID=A0A834H9J4_RHOSS|nr:hypothetical protein RHSIM_Rhsim03G0188800 [Rhododendron simsii]
MSAAQNTVDTVNAAATAIVTAESRVQPTTVQKKRWRICWSLYWCFGTYKASKKISHAVLIPEPVVPGASAPVTDNPTHPNTILLPFIAPPSSPASFLQSDPPSATQSPAGTLSLASLSIHAYSPSGTTNIFTVGPYAHETQLVSPPVLSTFNTEPSTASFTPPPEPVQLTSPSSPEVPFAQLLASSLGRARRNSGPNQKFTLSPYEFQPYYYQGSPVSNLISPGSVVSNSGTSSPFPDKPSIVFRIEEVPKLLAFKNFYTRKWGSRLGSGSLTPDGVEPMSRDCSLIENQIFEVASAANSKSGSQNGDVLIDYRVSFELTGEKNVSESLSHVGGKGSLEKTENCGEYSVGNVLNGMANEVLGEGDEDEDQCSQKYRSISLGSIKEFNFDNTKGEVSEKPAVSSEWWANEKVVGEEFGPDDNWTFFPVLQSRVS